MPKEKTLHNVSHIKCIPRNKKCEIEHRFDNIEGGSETTIEIIKGFIDLDILSPDLTTVYSSASEGLSFDSVNYTYFHEDGKCDIYKNPIKSSDGVFLGDYRVTIKCNKRRR